jgi:hypothetical protein
MAQSIRDVLGSIATTWCSSMGLGRHQYGSSLWSGRPRLAAIGASTAQALEGDYSGGLVCAGGITALCVFDGAINGERFGGNVEQMLAPTLRQGDIVLLDNLSSH